jgi:uncharacterized RDD family membrane protein YckC
VTGAGARIPREARPFQGRRAGVASRVLAAALDGLVVSAVFAGSYAGTAAMVFLWNPSRFRFPPLSRPLVLIAGYLIGVVYLALCWRISGRTYGDQVLGLRVVGRGDTSLGFGTALIRAVVCVVFPIGLLWTAVSRRNLSVADVLLRTSVVYDWPTAAPLTDAAGQPRRPARP